MQSGSLKSWLNLPSRGGWFMRRRRPLRFRPSFEALEWRCTPATFNPPVDDDAASLRAAIAEADANADASNTIILNAGDYRLNNPANGHLLIQNTSNLSDKTLNIVGQGSDQTIIDGPPGTWRDRIFEVVANAGTVSFANLAIQRGQAGDGGQLGGPAALGGGLLIDGGQVSLAQVLVSFNSALGTTGQTGPDGNGTAGGDALGGGIYLAAGSLTIESSVLSDNHAQGGSGGSGAPGLPGIDQTMRGQNGADGTAGMTGQNGADGQNGGNGQDAMPGTDGTDGEAGDDGPSSKVGGSDGGLGGTGGLGGAGYGGSAYDGNIGFFGGHGGDPRGTGGRGANGADGGNGGDGSNGNSGDGGQGGDGGSARGGGVFVNGALLMIDTLPTSNTATAGLAGAGGLGGIAGTSGFHGAGGHGGMGGAGGVGGVGGANGPNGDLGADGNDGSDGDPGQAGNSGLPGNDGLSSDPDLYVSPGPRTHGDGPGRKAGRSHSPQPNDDTRGLFAVRFVGVAASRSRNEPAAWSGVNGAASHEAFRISLAPPGDQPNLISADPGGSIDAAQSQGPDGRPVAEEIGSGLLQLLDQLFAIGVTTLP
jgi:hypothetical protein